MRFTPLLFSPLVALATLCVAAPKYNMLDVYTPSILMPVEGDVWPVNSVQSVIWDTTNPPAQISNPSGAIYLKNATSGLILMDRLLASRFNISDGQHDIVVPDVPCGPYQIVLVGDSGNSSPVFSIVAEDV